MADVPEIERVALLREPARRQLYAFVRGTGRAVGRDEAAGAVGISRAMAAFHLDRLAEAGLLEVEYGRLTGRSGRGAGRPAKLYAWAERRTEVSVPPTRYALAGDLLIRAIRDRRPEEPAEASLPRSANEYGRAVATGLSGPRRSRGSLGRMRRALDELGYEPAARRGTVILRNCPFHELVRRHPDVVCGLNLAFLRGVAQGLGAEALEVRPHDEAGTCCVAVGTGS